MTDLDMRRDGSVLRDLSNFCMEMQEHVRDLTKRLKLADLNNADLAGARGPSSTLTRTLRSTTHALSELLDAMPMAASEDDSLESRLLCLGLLAQWLDHDADILRRSRKGMHGHSSTLPLTNVVEMVANQRKTGILKIRAPRETFFLEFDNGDVVHAFSDNSPVQDRLGEILVAQGALSKHQLEDILRRHAGSRRKFGNLVEVQRLVGEDGLKRALETQVQRLFVRLFDSIDAYFEFIEDAAEETIQKVRLGAMSLLLESATNFDQGQAGGERSLGSTSEAFSATPAAASMPAPETSRLPEPDFGMNLPDASDEMIEASDELTADDEGPGSFLRKYGISGSQPWRAAIERHRQQGEQAPSA